MSNTNPAGIRCAHCKGRHATIAAVKVCAQRTSAAKAQEAADEAEARAEYEAERRAEQWYENGGAHAEVIAWEHDQDRLRGEHPDVYWGNLAGQHEAAQEREAYMHMVRTGTV